MRKIAVLATLVAVLAVPSVANAHDWHTTRVCPMPFGACEPNLSNGEALATGTVVFNQTHLWPARFSTFIRRINSTAACVLVGYRLDKDLMDKIVVDIDWVGYYQYEFTGHWGDERC